MTCDDDHVDDQPGPVIERHAVPGDALPVRLDDFAARAFARVASRSSARKAARRGDLRVDGATCRPSEFLQADSDVSLHLDQRPPPKPWDRPITVVHADDACAVVIKPPGVPTSGNRWRTLQNALPGALGTSGRLDALRFARPVHRLDTRTSGLMVIARTASAMMHLSRAFAERRVLKTYVALASGRLDGSGTCEVPVGDRSAVTHWQAIEHVRCLRTEWVTVVQCQPHTGRTHQIRRHLAYLGVPIVGDDLYGTEGRVLRGKGLFLWATALEFPHPDDPQRTVRMTYEPPPKLQAFLDREQRRYERHHPPVTCPTDQS